MRGNRLHSSRSAFGSSDSLTSSWVWCHKPATAGRSDILTFFSADPHRLWNVGDIFSSLEMFEQVRVRFLAGLLEDTHRDVRRWTFSPVWGPDESNHPVPAAEKQPLDFVTSELLGIFYWEFHLDPQTWPTLDLLDLSLIHTPAGSPAEMFWSLLQISFWIRSHVSCCSSDVLYQLLDLLQTGVWLYKSCPVSWMYVWTSKRRNI